MRVMVVNGSLKGRHEKSPNYKSPHYIRPKLTQPNLTTLSRAKFYMPNALGRTNSETFFNVKGFLDCSR